MFRLRSQQRRIFAILMLLGLLFQVQTVLACQMTGATMPAERCCCDEAKPELLDPHNDHHCCQAQAELSFKDPDASRELPAIVQANPLPDLPDAAVVMLVVAAWAEALSKERLDADWPDPPPSNLAGTKTYLSTQRLRI